jgi:hypothetical protein
MLRSIRELERYEVRAVDGDAGRVLSFLLDEDRWEVRSLLVQALDTPVGRGRVALPLSAVSEVDAKASALRISLTREALKQGPEGHADTSSASELRGYHLEGLDGVIGRVEDSLVDDQSWAVRYLVVDARPWSVGKRVLVAPQWATRVSWAERKVLLGVPRQAFKDGPPWSPEQRLDRDYEAALHRHHGRPAYWETEGASAAAP